MLEYVEEKAGDQGPFLETVFPRLDIANIS